MTQASSPPRRGTASRCSTQVQEGHSFVFRSRGAREVAATGMAAYIRSAPLEPYALAVDVANYLRTSGTEVAISMPVVPR